MWQRRWFGVLVCGLFAACGSGGNSSADAAPDSVTDTGDIDGADTTPDGSGSDADTDADTDADNDAADGSDAPDTTGPACGTDSPTALAACVDRDAYIEDLEFAARPRPTGTAAAAEVAAQAQADLEAFGFEVTTDSTFGPGTNIIATLAGTTSPDERVVVSAHYDSVPDCTGADDNATGVAGALEIARVLATAEHDRTLVVALWDEEERSKIGSWHWTDRMISEERSIVVHFVLEMIGYTDDTPGAQTLPAGFDQVFPDVSAQVEANEYRGDFIALIANQGSSPYVDAIVEYGAENGLPTVPAVLAEILVSSTLTGDLRRSDHEGSWAAGYPAMMITDTSEFRYPGYHCADGEDSVDRLDHDFATRTIAATIYAAATALSDDAPTTGVVSDRLRDCDPVSNDGCAEGQKCAMVSQPAGWYAFTCVELEPAPVGLGEICTRPDGTSGLDTCDVGHFCAFWGQPFSDPPTRTCQAACGSNDDCGDGQACVGFSATIPNHGVCSDTCDPFAADACGEGLHCIGERVDSDGDLPWTCNRIRETAAGERCNPGFDNCAEGLSCGYSNEDGIARCGAPCNDENPCADALDCQVPTNTRAEQPSTGVCH